MTPTPPALDLATLRGWIEVGIPCSSEHALEVIARAEAAEAKIAAVEKLLTDHTFIAEDVYGDEDELDAVSAKDLQAALSSPS